MFSGDYSNVPGLTVHFREVVGCFAARKGGIHSEAFSGGISPEHGALFVAHVVRGNVHGNLTSGRLIRRA